MPRTDLSEQSATRAELDERSRNARLRLEYVERLLVLRPLQRQSLLRRVLRCLGSRTRLGEQIRGRSVSAAAGRGSREEVSAGSSGVAGGFPGAPPAGAWPNCPGAGRIGPGRSASGNSASGWSDRALTARASVWLGFKPWDQWCGRGDLNSHVLSDNRF